MRPRESGRYPVSRRGAWQQAAKGPQPAHVENAEMSKRGSKIGHGSRRPSVGDQVLQIALPFDDASDTASVAELNRDRASGTAKPTGTKDERKRKKYSLYDKVYAIGNLRLAWEKVRSNKGAAGCDGVTIARFAKDAEANLAGLHQELREKRYRPRPVRRVMIPKASGGMRPLGIPTVRDRIVQQALLQVLGPIFEDVFCIHSHGFRPKRGCRTALEMVDKCVSRWGYEYVVNADICGFFEAVDHEILLAAVAEEIADGSVLDLIRAILESGVTLADAEETERAEKGTPQGGPLSPLLANIYLHPLDVAVTRGKFGYVRYADDFVILTKRRERSEEALALIQQELAPLKLQLHPEKTYIAALDEGFDFLGYHYFRDPKSEVGLVRKVISHKSKMRFHAQVRERTPRHAGQKRPKVKRCTVQRLLRNQRVQAIIERLNLYTRGWHWYFKHVFNAWGADEYFDGFDRFIRRRLRSAICGRFAKGRWNQILSNRTLQAIGLISIQSLHRQYLEGHLLAPPNSG